MPPKILYKYEPFSTQSLKNLKAQSVYFGSPLNFNDPYDCAITAGVSELDDSQLELARKWLKSISEIPEQNQHALDVAPDHLLKISLRKMSESTLENFKQKFLKNRGVTCFSETNDDLLMWSHYGGRYKGYV
jgi:hypothetical protein